MGMGLIEGGGGGGLQFPDCSINGVHIPRRRRSCWVGSKFKDVEVAGTSITMFEAATILIAMANADGGFCKKYDGVELEKKRSRKRKNYFSPLALAPATKKQRKKKMRKEKIELPNSNPPDMPTAMRDRIVEMGGYEIQLVIQKQLQDTDLNKNHGRLSLPPKQVRVQFTTEEEEKRLLNEGDDDHSKNVKKGMEVMIMDPAGLEEASICLKKWKIGSDQAYCLMTHWNAFVQKTRLATGDCIQLWSYRRHIFDDQTATVSSHRLCFAIAKLHISQ